tara:strand:+ start:871 stop:1203 length:333 start_codon:yes stop_codon:yes gene_type:complete
MAKRDRNRFRKTYPYLRKKPVFETVLGGGSSIGEIEVGIINYNKTDVGTHTFTTTFSSVPTITAIAAQTSGGSSANVNVYVELVDLNTVQIRVSDANFIGSVHFHAIAPS